MTGATLLFTMYISDSTTPSVALVLLETTNLIFAPFATAPDHSTSRSASPSSSSLTMPGSVPLTMTSGLASGNPYMDRKVATSLTLRLLRPAIAMIWPVPSNPWFHKGARS